MEPQTIADGATMLLLGAGSLQAFLSDRTGDVAAALAESGVEKLSRAAALRVFDDDRYRLMRALEDQVNLWVRPRFTGM